MSAREEIDRLFAGWLAGALAESDGRRLVELLGQADHRRRWRALADLEGALAELGAARAAEPASSGSARPARPALPLRHRFAIAGAAALIAAAIAIAAWAAGATAPAVAHLVAGGGETRLGDRATGLEAPAAIAVDAELTAAAMGASLRYDDGTELALDPGTAVRLLAADAGAGKRVRCGHGRLAVRAAPQAPGRPLVIATPDAEVTVIGTEFVIACDDAGTRLEVARGRVRLERMADHAAIEVAAGESALAAVGGELRAAPTAAPTQVLLDLDFEPGGRRAPGQPVSGPDGHVCLAGAEIPPSQLRRVLLSDAVAGLFAYRDDAELSFAYWVDDRVGSLNVYLWDASAQASMGGFELYPPGLERGRWSRATVRLADLRAGAAHLRPGDLVTELTIQVPGSGRLYVDDVRVVAPRPP